MIKQTGTFNTVNASKYLQQLCKHFAHKVEVTYDPTHGEAAMPNGPAVFDATDEMLTITVSGDSAEKLEQMRHVIDIHLKKFAFREEFEAMNWEPIA